MAASLGTRAIRRTSLRCALLGELMIMLIFMGDQETAFFLPAILWNPLGFLALVVLPALVIYAVCFALLWMLGRSAQFAIPVALLVAGACLAYPYWRVALMGPWKTDSLGNSKCAQMGGMDFGCPSPAYAVVVLLGCAWACFWVVRANAK